MCHKWSKWSTLFKWDLDTYPLQVPTCIFIDKSAVLFSSLSIQHIQMNQCIG
uniref:Uncharacterized protein n=1 Tax=Kalanchoe fedtschenkoi TaxID=63787 RepID=A0A7N0TF71_KALFE